MDPKNGPKTGPQNAHFWVPDLVKKWTPKLDPKTGPQKLGPKTGPQNWAQKLDPKMDPKTRPKKTSLKTKSQNCHSYSLPSSLPNAPSQNCVQSTSLSEARNSLKDS